jgi:SAM-dependent methyltransferase
MPRVEVYGKVFNVNEVYQPVYGKPGTGKRACDDRLRTLRMADALFDNNRLLSGSVADIGCNLGYFLFKLSEENKHKLVGIDKDGQVIAIANHIKKHKAIKNVSFKTAAASGQGFPEASTYFVFSVLHHVMKGPVFADDIFLKQAAKHATTMYVELATHLEHPHWAKKLVIKGNPYTYWARELARITDEKFNVRLVGMHSTHINTVRPMYQLKKKLKESLVIGGKEYTVYDRWTTAYRGYRACRLDAAGLQSGQVHKSASKYMFATNGGEHWFVKQKDDKYTVRPKLNGLLLSDILKYSLLNFYDVLKIEKQLLKWARGDKTHPDAHPWNFMVTETSDLVAIDEEGKSLFGDSPDISKKLIWTLINLLH